MEKHTPGPWSVSVVGTDHCQVSSAEILDTGYTEFFCKVYDGTFKNPNLLRNNAQLIAAAPELLEACQAIVNRWEKGDLAEAARMCQYAIDEATSYPTINEHQARTYFLNRAIRAFSFSIDFLT